MICVYIVPVFRNKILNKITKHVRTTDRQNITTIKENIFSKNKNWEVG